jgi:hypothetical protein
VASSNTWLLFTDVLKLKSKSSNQIIECLFFQHAKDIFATGTTYLFAEALVGNGQHFLAVGASVGGSL